MTSRLTRLYVNVGLCLVLQAGCGKHEDQPKRSSGQSEDDAEAASGRGTGGAAGSGLVLPPLGTVPTVECNANAQNESSCGDTECPELPPESSGSCIVSCCTDTGKCGVRNTTIVAGIAVPDFCIERALEDSRCPSTTLGATMLPGCCDATGHCGQLYGTVCLSSGTGPACE